MRLRKETEMSHRSASGLSSGALPADARIGSGIALASSGRGVAKDNPHHWQTLILLLPLFHNPDPRGNRRPIPSFLLGRTVDEIQRFFSGYTVTRATGWYWNESGRTGVPDELVRFEMDGVFTGDDLRLLSIWKETLRRRFRQDYIYMRLVSSGVAL
jgi:hypothetical protein